MDQTRTTIISLLRIPLPNKDDGRHTLGFALAVVGELDGSDFADGGDEEFLCERAGGREVGREEGEFEREEKGVRQRAEGLRRGLSER